MFKIPTGYLCTPHCARVPLWSSVKFNSLVSRLIVEMMWISLKFFFWLLSAVPRVVMSLSRHYFRKALPRSVSFPPPTYLFTVSPAYSQSHSESLYALSESLPRQRRQFAQSPFNQIIRYWYCGVSEGVWKRSVCSSTTYCQTDIWYPYKDKKAIVRSQEYSANTIYWHIMIQVSVRKYKSSVKFTYAD